MSAWLSALAAIAKVALGLVSLFQKKQEAEQAQIKVPPRPPLIDRLLKRKRSPSAGSASGSSEAK